MNPAEQPFPPTPEEPGADSAQTPEQTSGPQAADDAAGQRVTALEAELTHTKEQLLRALADAENIRKRAQREREDAAKYAASAFAKDLLAVADNFRRAIDSIPDELKSLDERVKGIIDGVEATEREMLSAFDRHGIKKILPMDLPFDPNFHEVMFEAPVPGKAPGTVIQIIEPGYTMNGRLLRPARVGVAKAASEGGNPGGHQVDTQA